MRHPSRGEQCIRTRECYRQWRIKLYSIHRSYDVNWYDSTQWLANAFSSITTIVEDYSADGIDIDIERFSNDVGSDRPTNHHYDKSCHDQIRQHSAWLGSAGEGHGPLQQLQQLHRH